MAAYEKSTLKTNPSKSEKVYLTDAQKINLWISCK